MARCCSWPSGCSVELSALRDETLCHYHGKVASGMIETTRTDSSREIVEIAMSASMRERARRERMARFERLLRSV
jgi:hypothetical protein